MLCRARAHDTCLLAGAHGSLNKLSPLSPVLFRRDLDRKGMVFNVAHAAHAVARPGDKALYVCSSKAASARAPTAGTAATLPAPGRAARRRRAENGAPPERQHHDFYFFEFFFCDINMTLGTGHWAPCSAAIQLPAVPVVRSATGTSSPTPPPPPPRAP
jgi:hypothetical protein